MGTLRSLVIGLMGLIAIIIGFAIVFGGYFYRQRRLLGFFSVLVVIATLIEIILYLWMQKLPLVF